MKRFLKQEIVYQKTDGTLFTRKDSDNINDIFYAIAKGLGWIVAKGSLRMIDTSTENIPAPAPNFNKVEKNYCKTGETFIDHQKKYEAYKKPEELTEMYNNNYLEEKIEENNILKLESKACKNNFKILIIDDKTNICEEIRKALKLNGFENVKFASTFEEALNLIKTEDFALILSDYRLKDGTTGLQIYKEMQDLNLLTPFILTTGYSEYELAMLKKTKYSNLLPLSIPFSIEKLIKLILKIYVKFIETPVGDFCPLVKE